MRSFIQCLAPFVPHLAEELWERLGEKSLLVFEPWPTFDLNLAKDDQITIAVQVMGKTRGTLEVAPGTEQLEVEREAKNLASVASHLAGKQIKKIIFVRDKIINFVA